MGVFDKSGSPPQDFGSGSGQQTTRRAEFVRQVLEALRSSGRFTSAEYNPDEFVIVYQLAGASGQGRLYLENTFRETESLDPAERSRRIGNLVGSAVGETSSADDWAQARPRLRSVIRSVTFGELQLANLPVPPDFADESTALLGRPVLPFLMEAVVVDWPTSRSFVSRAQFAAWKVAEEDVYASARANLAALAGSRGGPSSHGPTLRFVDDGDSYWTSMLLVRGFLAGLSAHVGGRPVAFIPDRDTLVVTSDNPASLPGVYQAVERQYREAPRKVSPVGYTVDDEGAVRPYIAPAGSPLAAVAHRAEVILAGDEYAVQKRVLDKVSEAGAFVAQLMVLEQPGSPGFSVAVWTQDLDTLLPQADFIGFQPTDGNGGFGDPFTVPFDVVAQAGLLVPEPGVVPPRFRVGRWPDPAVLARLRSHARLP